MSETAENVQVERILSLLLKIIWKKLKRKKDEKKMIQKLERFLTGYAIPAHTLFK